MLFGEDVPTEPLLAPVTRLSSREQELAFGGYALGTTQECFNHNDNEFPAPPHAAAASTQQFREEHSMVYGPMPVETETFSTVHLWGHSGRGHCRKISANFHEISAEFPHPFLAQ